MGSALLKLFISPHNDDAVLFGAFTLLRERPLVLTIFDSYVQVKRGHPRCSWQSRRKEDERAVGLLGCPIQFSGVHDDGLSLPTIREALGQWRPDEVWIPAVEQGGHEQHNIIGELGLEAFEGAKIHRYLTYTKAGKSVGIPVEANGCMVLKKLRALACYASQIEIDALGCTPHFLRDQNEYVLE